MDLENTAPKQIDKHLYEELVHYFKYASSAYSPFCARPNGNQLISHFASSMSGVEGFVARDSSRKELIVALRGSASVTDIIMDSQVELVPFISPGVSAPENTKVHAGFLIAWNSVAPQVLAIFLEALEFLNEDYQIVTSGHSLGGAMSILAATCLQQNFTSRVVRSYSYGAPRAGNECFAKWVRNLLGGRAFRVVHSCDGVPTMIPTSLGYHHHGIEYWQQYDPPSEETTYACSPDGEDPKCSASIPSGGINAAHMTYFGITATTPFCI